MNGDVEAVLTAARGVLQAVSLVTAVSAFAMLCLLVRKRVMPPGYAYAPGLCLIHAIFFYTAVFVLRPEPSQIMTTWSSVLRLHWMTTLAAILAIQVLCLYKTRFLQFEIIQKIFCR